MKSTFAIPSDFKKIKEVSQKILGLIDDKAADEAFLFDVKLACEEAMINAIKYGNKLKPAKRVRINCEITKEALVVAVEDEGSGFDFKSLPDPTCDENIIRAGGRGLFIIRNVMDKVEFNSKGNKIIMTKFFRRG